MTRRVSAWSVPARQQRCNEMPSNDLPAAIAAAAAADDDDDDDDGGGVMVKFDAEMTTV